MQVSAARNQVPGNRTRLVEIRIGVAAAIADACCSDTWLLNSRKEVIQPQVPLRLPCYDFTPVADLTVVGYLPCGLAHRLRVKPTPMV